MRWLKMRCPTRNSNRRWIVFGEGELSLIRYLSDHWKFIKLYLVVHEIEWISFENQWKVKYIMQQNVLLVDRLKYLEFNESKKHGNCFQSIFSLAFNINFTLRIASWKYKQRVKDDDSPLLAFPFTKQWNMLRGETWILLKNK